MSEGLALLLSAIAAILPALLYAWLIYWVDSYEKEPWWLLAASFLWGAVPAIGLALLFNTLLSNPLYSVVDTPTAEALSGGLIAPLVEESVKGLALLGIFFFWRMEIDSPLDGIIYGAMVGMGFAMVENFYYFVTIYLEQGGAAWSFNIFMRAVVFGLNHALFASMTGLGIAVARLSNRPAVKIVAPLLGWATAVFLHLLHNVTVTLDNGLWLLALLFDWAGLLLLAGIVIWALLQEQTWIKTYLADEVQMGTLSATQYQYASSKAAVIRQRLRALRTTGWPGYRASGDFYRRCSELAYKKHHLTLFNDRRSADLIDELRAEIRAQSGSIAQAGASSRSSNF